MLLLVYLGWSNKWNNGVIRDGWSNRWIGMDGATDEISNGGIDRAMDGVMNWGMAEEELNGGAMDEHMIEQKTNWIDGWMFKIWS